MKRESHGAPAARRRRSRVNECRSPHVESGLNPEMTRLPSGISTRSQSRTYCPRSLVNHSESVRRVPLYLCGVSGTKDWRSMFEIIAQGRCPVATLMTCGWGNGRCGAAYKSLQAPASPQDETKVY